MSQSVNTPAAASVFTECKPPNEQWLACALAEAALQPELPIVDPHVHLHLRHHRTKYRYTVEEFARDVALSGHNVEAAVFVECNSLQRTRGPEHLKCVGETEFAVGMAAIADSGIYTATRAAAGIVAYADLTLGEQTQEVLEAHLAAANGRLRGVRQRGKWDPDPIVAGPVRALQPGLYLDAGFREGLRLVASMGLVFDASVFHPQLPEVASLARAVPDANIVVIHTGSPVGFGSYAGRQKEVHASWLAGMRELSRCPNVSIKMGGLLMCLGNFDFTTAQRPATSQQLFELWRPYIEGCIELFGANRCMGSSNFPVEKAGIPYGTIWNAFKRLTATCSEDERRMIFAGTAKRIYRVD